MERIGLLIIAFILGAIWVIIAEWAFPEYYLEVLIAVLYGQDIMRFIQKKTKEKTHTE